MLRPRTLNASWLLAVLLPGLAWADAAPRLGTGWHGLAGVQSGVAIHPSRSTAGVVGLEASLTWLDVDQLWWAGLTTDALYDFGPDHVRWAIGPHAGWGPFGVDVGGVVAFTRDGMMWGAQVRPVLTIGVLALYGRWLQFPTSAETERHAGEVGVIVKLPLFGATPPPRPRPLPTPTPPSRPVPDVGPE